MSKSLRIISRLAWIAPALLLVLGVNQIRVALGLHDTLESGTEAVAQIIEYEASNRADVTYDYVSLRVVMPDGTTFTREQMALPHSLAPRLEGKDQVPVRVRRGADQEVVITEIAATQWRIAAINAAMSLVGALLLGGAVFAWNRYLARQGDPGQRTPEMANDATPSS